MKGSIERRRAEAGQGLWRARKKAGFTGERLAELTGVGQSQISKIENGLMLPSPEDLASMLSALNLKDNEVQEITSRFEEIRTDAVSWRVAHKFGLAHALSEYDKIWAQATHIRNFQTFYIPGLLQTREYATSVLEPFNVAGQKDVQDAVEAKIKSQRILLDQTRSFEFLIMDYALLSRYFPSQILIAQLDHISKIQALPNIRVLIQDVSRLRARPSDAGFAIFDEKRVETEGTTAGMSIHDPNDVRKFIQKFKDLSRGALQGGRAVTFLRKCKDALSEPAL